MIKIAVIGDWKAVQIISAILWPSFVLSGIASMLFFASFDPQELAYFATFPIELSRTAGYTLGFLLFWLLGAANISGAFFLMRVFDIRFENS